MPLRKYWSFVMQNKTTTWDVDDNGMNILEDGKRIAKIDPKEFEFIIAQMQHHLKWRRDN